MKFYSDQKTHFCSKGESHDDGCNCNCTPCLSRTSALNAEVHSKLLRLGTTETQKEIAEAIARAKLTIKK